MSHHGRCCCECEGDAYTNCSESSFTPDCWRVTFVGVTQCACSDTLNSCDPTSEDVKYTGLGATVNRTHEISQTSGVWASGAGDLTASLYQYNSTDGSCSGGQVDGSPFTRNIEVKLSKTSSTQFRLQVFQRTSPPEIVEVHQFFDDTITVDANTCEGILEFANDFTSCPDYDCGGIQQLAQDGTATARRCCP